MRKRIAAEAAQPEDEQLSAGKLTVPLLELSLSRFPQGDERTFGNPGIALRDLKGVTAAVDQLHP